MRSGTTWTQQAYLKASNTVFGDQFGTSVSKDPFLSFKFKGGAKGDKVAIKWTDNKGDSRTDEVVIA